ncbi:class I SAM-dependent methyltransferase [Gracilimonas sp.]|uniref:class I SAM-dependent methyltransferase n=1 Tax=Gracilimonas sp. TaxID=1974203 RepID=UPI00287264BC|nr:class I SAM-dependent methyltransferase [Gracilimonas sp.]
MIHKINDWFFSLVDRYMDFHYGDRKRKLLQGHPETVVEIGAGYGANFRYLRPGTKVIAIEPNESFNDLLKRRAKRYGIEIEIHNSGAEKMSLKNDSVDMVIGSLVLCTVESPAEVLFEIKRVLKKEGKYAFIEHIKADRHSWIYKVQYFVKKPWKWFFDGCHVTRKTDKIIRKSQFSTVEMVQFKSKTLFVPIIPHIYGVAIN